MTAMVEWLICHGTDPVIELTLLALESNSKTVLTERGGCVVGTISF